MSEAKQQVRDEFRRDVEARDDWTCRSCGAKYVKLDVHHITPRKLMPYGGYVVENGITLCESTCHKGAETFLKYRELPGRDNAREDARYALSPYNLYRLIGSSFEKALAACDRLAKDSE